MVAADVLSGDMPLSHWDGAENGFLLDVRDPMELAVENVPGAVNIPIDQLRARLDELPRDQEDPRHLPLRPTRLLRHADAVAKRIQRENALWRNVVTDPRHNLLERRFRCSSCCVILSNMLD